MNSIEVTEQDFQLCDKETDSIINVTAKKIGNTWMALCPKHDDHNPSLKIDEEDGSYQCFNPDCGFSGRLFEKNKIVAEYMYCDESGNPVYKVVRFGPKKSFAYKSLNENGKWVYGAKDIKKILYGLPELIDSKIAEPVFFVEGEKDVENLRKLGFIATTFHSSIYWLDEYNKYFLNRTVIVPPDNDKAGRLFSSNIAKSLNKVAKNVKWLELPGLGQKEDISDWIEKGGTAEELMKLADAAPNFSEVVGNILNNENYKIPQSDAKLTEHIDKIFKPRQYTELLLKKFEIKSDIVKRLWIYNSKDGIWKDNGEDYLKSVLRKDLLINGHRKINCVNEIIADVKDYLYEGKYFEEPSPYLIPFKNKIYDLKNNQFLDFSPDYFIVNKIPVNIDTENKSCPLIDTMFTAFVGEDFKIDLYELAAYCCLRDYPYNKFFILSGEGRNGKSTYINIITMFIGSENVSTINLKDIISNRFAAASLFKKLANVSVETDPLFIRNTAVIKQLTGEDLLSAEEKFEKRFQFRNYAKLIVVTNKDLKTADLTIGFGRRVKIINFEGKFVEGENADPFILDKITEAELEGFAWICLETLKNLYKRGFVFTIQQDYKGVQGLYDDKIQALNNFLSENVMKDVTASIPTVEFHERFNEYLIEKNIPSISIYKLNDAMKSLGYLKKQIDITVQGLWTTKIVWEGLKWK